MTSTYSPDLRLELMATGDQSGTWGVTTNTNLGTLLEQSIAGVLSVAEGDTTLTLTALNGASDQARNAVVILTGAMTAQRNVVVPTSNKLYLIKNSTTGGFGVQVKTAAGTGVVVAAGSSQWVYCDGTNVVSGLLGAFSNLLTLSGTDGTTFTFPSTSGTIVTLAATQTLSNKTFVAPVLGAATATSVTFGGTALSQFLDANSWTPAWTAAAGTITTVTTTYAVYSKINFRTIWGIRATCTANGTGATQLRFDGLPSYGVIGGFVAGYNETQKVALAGQYAGTGDNRAFITKYDGTYPWATGDVIWLGGSYEASS